nr:ankyrin repeat domain-containing protein [uncultured Pseudomonas sp.]
MANGTPTTKQVLDAAVAGGFEQVQRLVQAGADLNVRDDGETLLDHVVSAFTRPATVPAFAADMLRLLLQLGAEPSSRAPKGILGFSPDETLYA